MAAASRSYDTGRDLHPCRGKCENSSFRALQQVHGMVCICLHPASFMAKDTATALFLYQAKATCTSASTHTQTNCNEWALPASR